MKRLHVHLAVDDLDRSIVFYEALFGAAPTIVKPDYAKWMLEDPRVNFAVSTRGTGRGLDHLGIQADDAAELAAVQGRLQAAAQPLSAPGESVCCYARSDKAWSRDPEGIAWETFVTLGSTSAFDHDHAPTATDSPAGGACCPTAAPAQGPDTTARACCG